MDSEDLKGKWEQIKGKFHEKWGKLTDNDWMEAKGNKENEGGVAFNAYAVDPSISGDDLFLKLHLK